MSKFYATITLEVEADGVNQAVERLKAIEDLDNISNLEINEGPDELEGETEEEDEEE